MPRTPADTNPPKTPDAPVPEDEEEGRIDESLEETFPASDPPAHSRD